MPPNSETPHRMHALVDDGVCELIILTLYEPNSICSKIKANVVTFVNHCGESIVTEGFGALSLAAAASFSSSCRRESSTALSSGEGLKPA